MLKYIITLVLSVIAYYLSKPLLIAVSQLPAVGTYDEGDYILYGITFILAVMIASTTLIVSMLKQVKRTEKNHILKYLLSVALFIVTWIVGRPLLLFLSKSPTGDTRLLGYFINGAAVLLTVLIGCITLIVLTIREISKT